MKLINWLIFAFAFLLTVSCAPEIKGTPYSQHGISFSIPEGWKKVETPIADKGVYILLEKQGVDESGQLVMNILQDKMPLDNFMEVMKEMLSEPILAQKATIDFTTIKREDLNGNAALVCSFSHNIAGGNFRGQLITFHCEEKSVCIYSQESLDDVEKNRIEMKLIKQSIACEVKE